MTDRLRLAVPNKGRLLEPSLALLRDAGYSFEDRERALVAPVRNAEVDILFVRTGDVVEFVADGVADLGITGSDLLAESGAPLEVVRRLGFGKCRLAVAVPDDAPDGDVAALAGRRVATSHPRIARRWFADRAILVEVVPLSGSVEVAPRLGLADAIVDLVSSGSTLAMNGLREIADVLEAEATLVASAAALGARPREIASLDLMLGAAVAARGKRYVMMNAPEDRLATIEALIPGLESPSVLRLSHAGMIAIHVVVDADSIADLLPRLRSVGASGILVLPIEQLVA